MVGNEKTVETKINKNGRVPGTPTFRMYGLSMLHCTEDNLQCTSHGFAPHNIWNMNWNPVDMMFGEILCSFVICGYHDLWWPLYVVICNVWGFVTIIICYNLWFVMIWFLMIFDYWDFDSAIGQVGAVGGSPHCRFVFFLLSCCGHCGRSNWSWW